MKSVGENTVREEDNRTGGASLKEEGMEGKPYVATKTTREE